MIQVSDIRTNIEKSVHSDLCTLSPSFRGGGKIVMFLTHWLCNQLS